MDLTAIALLITIWVGVHAAYPAVMAAKAAMEQDTLTLYWRVNLLPIALVGVLLDVAFQFTFGWLIFLETPFRGGLMFSGRVQHHFRHSTGWRQRMAVFFARNLNVFDSEHIRL